MIGVNKPRTKNQILKTRPGFTLVEMLITMTVFTTMMISLTDIYVQNLRYGQQIVLRAKLQADARNALEDIARAVRVSDINYTSAIYGGTGTLPAAVVDELDLVNPKTGDTSKIRLESTSWESAAAADAACYGDGKSYPCIDVSTNGGANWSLLSPQGVKIDSLKFFITPNQDPFSFNQATGAYPSSKQPIVTIFVQFHGIATRPSDQWIYALQTTVTPRLYLR
jgi:prepilin-type N-terminal cleavage/methylation domain-containing protein